MLGRREREAGEGGGRGRDVSFVAERHPEDVDPENKSTVLKFHRGDTQTLDRLHSQSKKEKGECFVHGSKVSSFPRQL